MGFKVKLFTGMKMIYNAKVEGGRLKLTNKAGFINDMAVFEGKDLVLTVERKRKKRSLQQGRYYWGCVVPIIRQGLIDAGWERDKIGSSEQVHELLKYLFCKKIEVFNEDTGEVLELPATTTQLSTTEMMEYLEDIKKWAAEFLGVYIPDPNEQLEFGADGW